MKYLLRLFLPILALLLLAACTAAPVPTATPPPTDTPAPTDTPVPPTKTPIPSPTPLAYPPARIMPRLVYDTQTNQVFITYGYKPVINGGVIHDTWAFDSQARTWKSVKGRSDCEYVENSIYDPIADRIILYCDANAIVEYDVNTDSWRKRDTVNAPQHRSFPLMAYDSESEKIILFGGVNLDIPKVLDETWAYDAKTNAWTKMEPAVHPPAITGIEMAYDAESDRVILWGGYKITSWDANYGDWAADPAENLVWAYDYNTNTWEKLPVIDGPALPPWRIISEMPIAMAYVPELDRIFVYGEDQFYSYDYNTNHWEKAKGDLLMNGPGQRMSQDMVYLPTIQRLLVFGGMRVPVTSSTVDYKNDTWLYDPQSGEWTQVGP